MTEAKDQTQEPLTISPLALPLLRQTFLGQVLVLVFVPFSTEVVFAGLLNKRKTEPSDFRCAGLYSSNRHWLQADPL